ncbi:hypothetical protein GE21DRAFT_6018 [Neurospora crassa]|uniref:Uncharacterized protein n=1 Tax=Neurospora crassa (strain ATCC 24698 / 74-OR23-1A / CBS 708.71 / DSM 1257 / FGSC 987) TaxID=367110 RepID=V5IQ84_NEUCR|nr:hypothetical protein NCU16806 [Neurospora crassa OR74A]ESA42936.1 hypothetical protein NCU16806 [Neurospora crassa OR74A]KHE88648.1 hypothetical protein GE21DRAFT_6018 [Neurospora crassa]|eukprot:XP_011394401.1 hypothetical protein NCU16806 [Neurospora crassa OR74A]
MAPWDFFGDILAQNTEKISTDASQWAKNFLPQAGAAVSSVVEDAWKHTEQFSADAGEWVNQNLPIAADTLADILDNAKKHAEHVSIQLTSNVVQDKSQVVLGQDGETVELIPITVLDWATNVLHFLAETSKELVESARLEFEKAQKWAAEHPTATFFIILLVVAGVTSIVMVAYPQLIYKPMLDTVGFTFKGVRADSIAAAVHSYIGNVSPGSLFAFLQSAGADGYGAAALNAALRTAGVTMMTAGAADLIRQWMEGKFNGEVPVVEIGGL